MIRAFAHAARTAIPGGTHPAPDSGANDEEIYRLRLESNGVADLPRAAGVPADLASNDNKPKTVALTVAEAKLDPTIYMHDCLPRPRTDAAFLATKPFFERLCDGMKERL